MNKGKKLLWLCWLVLVLEACRPRDKAAPAAASLESPTLLAKKADSTSQVSQDGLAFAPLNKGTYQQLPPDLSLLLNQQYPGWVLPALSADDLKKTNRDHQGPYFATGDFDGNGMQDYVVQFRQGDTAMVAVYLWQAQKPPLKHMLNRRVLPQGKEDPTPLAVSRENTAGGGAEIRAKAGNRRRQDSIALSNKQHKQVFIFQDSLFTVVPPEE